MSSAVRTLGLANMILFRAWRAALAVPFRISVRPEPKSALHFLYIFAACPRGALLRKFLSCRRFVRPQTAAATTISKAIAASWENRL